MRAGASGTLIGLAALLALGAAVTAVRGAFPTWAGEAENVVALELDARWRSFAADLASASGCAVRYESPLRGGGGKFARKFTRDTGAWGDHGAVGMLRIGAVDGPAILVMPEGFLTYTEPSQAYERAGLKEPRRFAQELVEGAAFSKRAEGSETRVLGELLETRAVLIPVCITEGGRRGESQRARSRSGSPRRNFPVRWEEAVLVAPGAAGPYPASHAGVRALTAWLNSTPDCAALLRVTPKAGSGPSKTTFAAGTLEAFCAEVLGLGVRESDANGCMAAITDSLLGCGELSLSNEKWKRLGSANWSLEVTVQQQGGFQDRAQPVLLTAGLLGRGVSLTAAATSVTEGEGADMELLPLRKQGLLIEAVAKGQPVRVRLFFSGDLGSAGSMGQGRLAASESGSSFQVLLTASSPRIQGAAIRSKSPD